MPQSLRRTRGLWYPCADVQFRAGPAAGATPTGCPCPGRGDKQSMIERYAA